MDMTSYQKMKLRDSEQLHGILLNAVERISKRDDLAGGIAKNALAEYDKADKRHTAATNIASVIDEIRDMLEDQSDVDWNGHNPNRAMSLLTELDRAVDLAREAA
jgi:hypothetical protein